jgi:hypothetical protein
MNKEMQVDYNNFTPYTPSGKSEFTVRLKLSSLIFLYRLDYINDFSRINSFLKRPVIKEVVN